ncbi:MAG TPA: hypothetical protein VD816_12440 [Ohtaekwangia sp.]|nr:hypothetical protein [Ohtaekwangia sp.]
MKALKGVGLFAIVAIVISSCFNPPEFAIEPHIEFESIYFGDHPDDSEQDSLVLAIKFKDGDGDLGLDANNPEHNEFPFNSDNFYLAKDGEIKPVGFSRHWTDIPYYFIDPDGIEGKLVTYKMRRTPAYSFLPEFTSCSYLADTAIFVDQRDVAIIDPSLQSVVDTLISSNPENPPIYVLRDTFYLQSNPNYNNITVDFLLKDPNGTTFSLFDWGGCESPYYGRFPVLSDKDGSPLDGVLRYSIKSSGLKILFLTKTLKLRIQIKDRGLHTSNVIETPEFTLLDILR